MRLLTSVLLLSTSCSAACVWLRDAGNDGLAYCVDKATGDEGYFHYDNPDRRRDMNTHEIHAFINRAYEKQKCGNSGSISSLVTALGLPAPSQNWTIFGVDMFDTAALPAVILDGMNALHAASSAISDAADRRLRQLRGDTRAEIGSLCVRWQDAHCTHRISFGHYYMTEAQMLAVGRECDLQCEKLGRQCKYRMIDIDCMEHQCSLP